MKLLTLIVISFLSSIEVFSQTPITSVFTTSAPAASSFSYTHGADSYQWGTSPYNNEDIVNSFTAGGIAYGYAGSLTGVVRLRRVDNPGTSGNFSLLWSESITIGFVNHSISSGYQNDMEIFLNNRIYNRGADNFFDNTSANSNNIERFDWVLSAGYSTPSPSLVGFSVFDRGNTGTHDDVCIAAITSLDMMGNPDGYSNIVRVTAANYNDPGPSVGYRVFKSQFPSNLLSVNAGVQNRGGTFISLQDLGIIAGQTVYGYSLFSGDLPVSATPADLIDYTNTTFFPTNTGNPGGIDLIAVTGLFVELNLLETDLTSLHGIIENNTVNLTWEVQNERTVDRYEVERSVNGRDFKKVNEIRNVKNSGAGISYSITDNITGILSGTYYYRVKTLLFNGKHAYSTIIRITPGAKNISLSLYPNPVHNQIILGIPSERRQSGSVIISSVTGSTILLKKIQLLTGTNILKLDCSNLPRAGVYFISVHYDSGKLVTRRFVKY